MRNALAKGPTPRIMLMHGGIYPVHLAMESFGKFLAEMGYPESQMRDPFDGNWSHSPYEDAERLAGILAWYYEKEGMPPMIIGHSQGGMQAIKVLHVLNGEYERVRSRVEPAHRFRRGAHDIVDPLTGRERPVVGIEVSYVVGDRRRRRRVPAAQPMEHASASCARFPTRSTNSPAIRSTSTSGRGRCPASMRREVQNGGKATSAQRARLPAGIQPRLAPVIAPLADDAAMAHVDQRVCRRRNDRAAAARKPGQHRLGRRRLVRRQETLGDRGAAPDPRQARRAAFGRGGQVKIEVFSPGGGQPLRRRGVSGGDRDPVHVSSVGRKSGARHRRGARHRARDRAQARAPTAATSPSTTTTAPMRPKRCARRSARWAAAPCAIQGSVGIPDSVDEMFAEFGKHFERLDIVGQQRRQRRAQAHGRHDAQALALVPGDQRARVQPARAARAAADARRRAHHRDVEPRRAARDAGLRLHRRVQGGARVAGARARAGARPARHPRQRGERRGRRHRCAAAISRTARSCSRISRSARRRVRC